MERRAGMTDVVIPIREPAAAMLAAADAPASKGGRPIGSRQPLERGVRAVHRGHFAFMRAVVQGLPMGENFHRYLPHEADAGGARSAATTLAWLRAELAAAARKEHRYATARLMSLAILHQPDSLQALPGIDEWASARGLEVHSEAEKLQAYQAAQSTATRHRMVRHARLVEQQLSELRWLEDLIVRQPQAGDACGAWFTRSVEQRLSGSGLFTLAQLVDRINGAGRLWYRPIAGLGARTAQRLQAWLRAHESSLGRALGPYATVARSRLYAVELAAVQPPATAIRPLEKFQVPAELDGRAGRYRQPQAQCLMRARNDYEAILAWLQAKRPKSPAAQAQQRARKRGRDATDPAAPLAWLEVLSHTQRSCRKEAERFLLWAILARGKPLSSMSTEDCIAYRDFLADPQPADTWCGPRGRERWSPLWRPFEGPLSQSAQHLAITQLCNLYTFLANQNYLMGNPWMGVATPRRPGPGLDASRRFTARQWQLILDYVKGLDDTEKNRRIALALGLLYATGLRLGEAVNAKVADLTWVEYPPDSDGGAPVTGWELKVLGKGEKLREVVVPESVVALLRGYLVARGLPGNLNASENPEAFLLAPLTHQTKPADRFGVSAGQGAGAGLAAATLYALLKTLFDKCADDVSVHHPAEGDRIRRASTHWLRHTHASHAIANGVPIKVAQASLGHASLATTTVYVTTEKARRMRAMQEAMK